MAISTITNPIVDGSTVLQRATFEPLYRKINEIATAVNGLAPATPTKILIAGEPDDAIHGSVSIHGLTKEDLNCAAYYAEVGEYVVLHATDGKDFTFEKWVTGNSDTVVSTQRNLTILVTSDMTSGKTYKAVFAGSTVEISTSVNSSVMGSVSAGGTKQKGSQVTLTATPAPISSGSSASYYKFVNWQKKNTDGTYSDISGATNAMYTFTASEDAEYRAVFAAKAIGSINVKVEPITGGIKIVSVTADNANKYEISVNDAAYEVFTENKEITAQSTIKFKASNTVTGVEPAEAGEIVLDYDANTTPATLKMYSTIHQMNYNETGNVQTTDNPTAANSKVTLTEGKHYYIKCNGKDYEIDLTEWNPSTESSSSTNS